MSSFGSIRRLALAGTCAAALLAPLALGSPASAACGYDPANPPLTIRQMILQGTTEERGFPILLLGRVVRLHDLDGQKGGHIVARFRLRAHPLGTAPHSPGVVFWKPPPGESVSDNFEFRTHRLYAVLAHPVVGGAFRFDGACGQTKQVSVGRIHQLVHLARQ